MTERWTYLGPQGTFTQQAALSLAAGSGAVDLQACASVPAALEQVRAGTATAAVVPLENSVEGSVTLTQDELIHGPELRVAGEALVGVRFDLLVRPGTTLQDIRAVGSHPHGHAQVRSWLREHLPQADTVETMSTAAAAADVAAGRLDAAAAAPMAGELLGLVAAARDIGLHRGAVTRFVLVRPPGPDAPPTGTDRVSLVLRVPNRPGTLLTVLGEFADRGVNLTRLESRPTREVMGEYLFALDADGHAAEPPFVDLLAALTDSGVLARYLGSYPRASAQH